MRLSYRSTETFHGVQVHQKIIVAGTKAACEEIAAAMMVEYGHGEYLDISRLSVLFRGAGDFMEIFPRHVAQLTVEINNPNMTEETISAEFRITHADIEREDFSTWLKQNVDEFHAKLRHRLTLVADISIEEEHDEYRWEMDLRTPCNHYILNGVVLLLQRWANEQPARPMPVVKFYTSLWGRVDNMRSMVTYTAVNVRRWVPGMEEEASYESSTTIHGRSSATPCEELLRSVAQRCNTILEYRATLTTNDQLMGLKSEPFTVSGRVVVPDLMSQDDPIEMVPGTREAMLQELGL